MTFFISYSLTQIGTNGVLSFDQPVYNAIPSLFPSDISSIHNVFIVAPFWDDVDIRHSGNIIYKIFTNDSGKNDAIDTMSLVNDYIQQQTGESFLGEWMLVVTWDSVHPWPHGELEIPFFYYFILNDIFEVSKLKKYISGTVKSFLYNIKLTHNFCLFLFFFLLLFYYESELPTLFSVSVVLIMHYCSICVLVYNF